MRLSPKNKPAPKLPYLIYLIENKSGRGADSKNLLKQKRVTAEVYTNTKNTTLEATVQTVLKQDEHEKHEEYIAEEKMYCVSWKFDIYEKIRRN